MNAPMSATPEVLTGFTFPDPPEALVACIQRLRQVIPDGRPLAERLVDVAAASSELARSDFEVCESCRCIGDGPYGRNLVYRDPDFGFVVIAMAWPAGCDAPVHDHGTWCAVAGLEGRVKVACYRQAESGSSVLDEEGVSEVAVGETCTVKPPCTDVHKVWNPFDEPALTLHVYGKDISSCQVYDLAGGSETHDELGYANL